MITAGWWKQASRLSVWVNSAWSIFEPEEGVYQFELFDRAIDLAYRHGLKVVLGTPTATPPALLTERYPEVLNVTYEGVTLQHGMRRHYNYSSPKYRELCARIVAQLAAHYGNHPSNRLADRQRAELRDQ